MKKFIFSKNTKASPSPLAMSPSSLSNASFEIELTKPTSTDVATLVIISGGRRFPPPITVLRSIKEGKSYAYFKPNINNNRFIVEDIKIPQTEILQAYRNEGRLKMYFSLSVDECCNEENENVNPIIEKKEDQNDI